MINTLLALMAIQYLNVPYRWGGNGPRFDCSGLVLKVLHDVGVTLPDMTSQSLYRWASDRKTSYSCEPEEDCLLFFGESIQHIKHVAISIGKPSGSNEAYMIEAGGAGKNSLNMSDEDLARIDARVRIKPISNRGDLVASIKIKYGESNE
jgi:cell wall-associated NlpC family hydrolase